MTPALLGISHVSLSVADMDAAARFWTEVMGFETFLEDPRFRFFIHRGAHLAVLISDHELAVTGSVRRAADPGSTTWRSPCPDVGVCAPGSSA